MPVGAGRKGADRRSAGRADDLRAKPCGAALAEALRRALAAFADTNRWRQIQLAGMRADLSWNEAAGRYLDLYAAARGRGPVPRVS
jgi:starch synthase